jgi:ABC-type polysaccharide/polyol phosphate export permease
LLVRQQLVLRYRRSTLGFFWTLLNPLMMMAVSSIVFSSIFKFQLKDYVFFMFSGMVPWLYFSNCISQTSASLLNNEGLIKKVFLPKTLFPLSTSIFLLIDSMFGLIALFIVGLFIGVQASWALLFIPVALVVLYIFTLGLGLLLSTIVVYFRDIQQIVNVGLQALYFLTPIMYPISAVSPRLASVLYLNPMYYFVEMFRYPLYQASWPPVETVAICISLAVVSFMVGNFVFRSRQNDFVFRL